MDDWINDEGWMMNDEFGEDGKVDECCF